MANNSQEGVGYDFFNQGSSEDFSRRNDPLSKTMASQSSRRNQFGPNFGDQYQQNPQNEFVQSNFIPVSEDPQSQQGGTDFFSQNQFSHQGGVEDSNEQPGPPPTGPLPVPLNQNIEDADDDDEEDEKFKTNFGFSSNHGVTYGHGPRRNTNLIQPPLNMMDQRPPTNQNHFLPQDMNTPDEEEELEGRPPLINNAEDALPPRDENNMIRPPISHTPPMMRTVQPQTISTNDQSGRPPTIINNNQQHQNQQEYNNNNILPPSTTTTTTTTTTTSNFEAARQQPFGNQSQTKSRPSHLPHPHHRKFNEEIPPPDIRSQWSNH